MADSYSLVLWGIYASSVVVYATLQFLKAPFGKFQDARFGPVLPGRLGWCLFESVSLFACPASYFLAAPPQFRTATQLVVLSLWVVHYFHRSFVYVLRAPSIAPTGVLTVVTAIVYNLANGYVNGIAIARFGAGSDSEPLPLSFYTGLALFLLGMGINIHSDSILFALRRKKSSTGQRYHIPRGGLFELVSCANYSGEILEWFGWALLNGLSGGPLSFLAFTLANLVPRAVSQHQWYHRTFGSAYPKSRKAVFPFLY
ncbi:3-oxo-5-alpha-steroid 4-dehydrogenase-domain-containing protein [Polychytrium aggregatum]|uniref:3-oxo-5-alpha-steroid 4-dehydrogenase-domain-containing protein n=1 Tax=Polychytrium aggregatum TaxID=110093 RepID=UPI0022FDEE5E|nr:3-oxo-5-alpha-steroid 4-dehydrogenase-domain-containing protein [Polychytrium aggregatum]KAI9208711.1 3-oxo-5-alpha-steroid 4-dehydrogenase-domain-containing protein [Polychytrium aggregatum]